MPAKSFKFYCLPILCWPSQSVMWSLALDCLFATLDGGVWTIVKQPTPIQCGMCLLTTSIRLTAMETEKGPWLFFTRDIGHNLRKKCHELYFCFETNIYWRLIALDTRHTLSHMSKRRNTWVKVGGFNVYFCLQNGIGILERERGEWLALSHVVKVFNVLLGRAWPLSSLGR